MIDERDVSAALHDLADGVSDGDDLIPYVNQRAERLRRRQRGITAAATLGVVVLVGATAVALAGTRAGDVDSTPSSVALAAPVSSAAPTTTVAPTTTGAPTTTAAPSTTEAPPTTPAPTASAAPTTTTAGPTTTVKTSTIGSAPTCSPTPGATIEPPKGTPGTVISGRESGNVAEPPGVGGPPETHLKAKIHAFGTVAAMSPTSVTVKVDPQLGGSQPLVLTANTRYFKGTSACGGLQLGVGDPIEFEAASSNNGPFEADKLIVP